MSEKRIKWVQTAKNYYHARNMDNDTLGRLEYQRTGRFMHWCWYQVPGVWMSPGCLQEVRDNQKELHSER